MKNSDPVKQTINSYNGIASGFAEDYFDYEKFHPSFMEVVKKFVSFFKKGSVILDAGCGPGRDVKFFSENGLKAIGIDASDRMINEARARFPKGDFRTMDMRNLEFDDSYFDGIWCCASLLHIPRDQVAGVLKEFYRLLKSNGILFACVMEGENEAWVKREEYDGSMQYFVFYSTEEIARLISNNNFNIIETLLTPHKNLTSKWIVIFAKKVGS